MITYVKGSLFDAPKGSVIGHAVNCQGVWGSGIAKQFRDRFPNSFEEYRRFSEISVPGDVYVCDQENDYHVICLYTSDGYGHLVDPKEEILNSTRLCLEYIEDTESVPFSIHIPKINSGLFGVPWEETEAIINEFPELNVIVYSLE